jgi:molecular chaperone HtpG
MTTSAPALVQFRHTEVTWNRPSHPLHIGKDVLELLSTSMYVDPMSMYREYIQNAADAVDSARLAGIENARRVDIRLDVPARTVFIRDNGVGLSERDFIHQLTALGGSKKRGTSARGFRGVGRLAGLAFCQELIFRSRQSGESTVHELKWDAREVRSLLRSGDDKSELSEIVAKSIQNRDVPGRNWPERFFEVELRGIIRHRDDRLLNLQHIRNYLAQVAPVPFHPDFSFSEQIRLFLESHGVRTGAIHVELQGAGPVYRPHRNTISLGKSGETQFQELTTLFTPGRDGDVSAVTWILHSDYRGSLPVNSLVDGWRYRAGDIQIGNNDLLQSLFPEPRFNGWCVAETHVLDQRILPNGRRDHFEQNAFYFDLLNHLAPHARDIAQRCRASSISRNAARTLDLQLAECEQQVRVISKGTMTTEVASKVLERLTKTLDHLERISNRCAGRPERQAHYRQRIGRLRSRVLRLKANGPIKPILEQFRRSHRPVLAEVFATIYQTHTDLTAAQKLIDKIVACLRRSAKRG